MFSLVREPRHGGNNLIVCVGRHPSPGILASDALNLSESADGRPTLDRCPEILQKHEEQDDAE